MPGAAAPPNRDPPLPPPGPRAGAGSGVGRGVGDAQLRSVVPQGRQSDGDAKTGRKSKEMEELVVSETVKGKPELVGGSLGVRAPRVPLCRGRLLPSSSSSSSSPSHAALPPGSSDAVGTP